MTHKLTDKLVDVLTSGNRPLRILIFGGIFLAFIIMTVLAKIFGVNTNIGGDVDLPNVILISVSLITGFTASYGIVRLLDSIKRNREEGE